MHAVIRVNIVFIKSWIVHHPDLSTTFVVDSIDDADLINVVYFNIVLLCRSSIVIVSVPLINLTPLQTFPAKKRRGHVEPNPKCVCV